MCSWLLTDPPARALLLAAFAALLICGGVALGRQAERADCARQHAELTAVRRVARQALRERDRCRASLAATGVP